MFVKWLKQTKSAPKASPSTTSAENVPPAGKNTSKENTVKNSVMEFASYSSVQAAKRRMESANTSSKRLTEEKVSTIDDVDMDSEERDIMQNDSSEDESIPSRR